jgi:hypothetical protein
MSTATDLSERGPAMIPGVYNYCDDWCEYCPVTSRCRSFAMRQEIEARFGESRTPAPEDSPPDAVNDPPAANSRGQGSTASRTLADLDMVKFTQDLAKADGLPTPGLDAALAGDPTGEWSLAPQDELLARQAMAYAVTAELLLAKVGWHPPDSTQLGTSPSPQDVIMWYHLFLALKTRRSLVAAHRATRGRPCAEDDARGSAKIALISIDRSREALRTLARGPVRSLARHLVAMLDVLAAGLEARVPAARCFVRPGLDDRT